ncbi:MAG: hypothetical protein ACRDD1_07370 [Planctomycetia bacterium]
MGIRQRRSVGAVLKAPLGDGWHAYAWTLPEADFAFFDLRASSDLPATEVVRLPVAFRVAVHKSAWTDGRWLRVGKAEPPPETLAPAPKFVRDALNGRLSIYLHGVIRPAAREECVGLECCAVWEPEHVEDRLRDHFAGRPNKWVRSMALD